VSSYADLPGLEYLYLEDSYALGIAHEPGELRIDLEAVLTEQHPRYRPPKSDEQYCYMRLAISFPQPRSVTWIRRDMKPLTDSTG
jgi:hypothetical protein